MIPTEKARVITDFVLLQQKVLAVFRSSMPADPSVKQYLLPGKKVSATGRMSSEPQIQEFPK